MEKSIERTKNFMNKQAKRQFKALFKKVKTVKISELNSQFRTIADIGWAAILAKWNLEKYFEIKDSSVFRNNTPTPWETIKPKLIKSGKWVLTKSIPVAIGLATGGVGFEVAVAPLIIDIIKKFNQRGLTVSKESEEALINTIQAKSDDSIDILLKKLEDDNKESIKGGITEKSLKNTISLCLNEELFFFISEIHAVVRQLRNQNLNLQEIFDDWMEEQREILRTITESQKIHYDLTNEILNRMDQNFGTLMEDFKVNLEQTNREIGKVNRSLVKVEDKFNIMFKQLCKTSLIDLSLEELWQISKIQFQRTRLAGKFAHPYNPALFILTPSLEDEVTDFLRQKGGKPVFLLLANIGMGKTWNSAYLGIMAREMKLAIPFFIPIYFNYDTQLGEIFNVYGGGLANGVGQKCSVIKRNTGKKVLLIFDGLDEYSSENRQPFLNFIDQIVRGYSDSISIILTDRVVDWIQNIYIQRFYRQISPFIHNDPTFELIRSKYKIITPVSGYLSGFTNIQLNNAIQNYNLDLNRFPSKLYDLCHNPYLLRLIFERQEYPDPDNLAEFTTIFWNPDNPLNTVLYRMNIIGSTEEFFFQLMEFFGNASFTKSRRDLQNIIENHKNEWYIILLSGIIYEERKGFIKKCHINPIFHAVINEYLRNVGRFIDFEDLKLQEQKIQLEQIQKILPQKEEKQAALKYPKWGEKLEEIFTQNLPDSLLKLQINKGTSEQRKDFLTNVITKIPPIPLNEIYNICRFFPNEINKFFSNENNLPYFDGIITMNYGEQIESINSDLSKSWDQLRSKKWPGTTKEIIQLISRIFSLDNNVSEHLVKKNILDSLKFIDKKWDIEAKTEEERKNLIERKKEQKERKRKLEEERKRKLEEERKKKLEEERKRKLEEERKRKLEEERKRKLEEERKRKLEEERKRKLEEEERKRKLEEEKKRKLKKERKRKLEEERKRKLEEKRKWKLKKEKDKKLEDQWRINHID